MFVPEPRIHQQRAFLIEMAEQIAAKGRLAKTMVLFFFAI